MSQVFVKKADLSSSVIPVYGTFPDLPWVARAALGAAYTPLSLPDSAVIQTPITDVGTAPTQLAANWRTNSATIAQGEAQRRILEVFTDYMQRNAMSDLQRSASLYGSVVISTWPADAQARYNEAQRGWAYVNAVRQTSDAITASLPTDPTDNSHWPTVITPPIYIPYV